MNILERVDGPLDRFDRAILDILAVDGRLPITELAQRIGLSKSPTQARLKRLIAEGYIRGFRGSSTTGSWASTISPSPR